ncbi:MAG: YlmC/YmxH family sporulation protein [Firmicutes bacterium]|nr:YlmC/YmxH family sporulation protein [Bacillota bacterium]
MDRIQSLKQKEVINLCDGLRLGCVEDIVVDTANGCVAAVIVPAPGRLFGVFGRKELYIKWCDIKKIGVDIIVVDVDINRCIINDKN